MKVVDWKVFAKREELVAKTFQEDTNFNLFLVLDTSASMGYKGAGSSSTKLHYASMLAACFAYIAFRQGDRVGLFAYGEEVQQRIRPKSGHAHFGRIVNALAQLKPEGINKHEAAWDQLVGNMPGRSMVVFLSDFLEAEKFYPKDFALPYPRDMKPFAFRCWTGKKKLFRREMPCDLLKWKVPVRFPLHRRLSDLNMENRWLILKKLLSQPSRSVSRIREFVHGSGPRSRLTAFFGCS